LREKRFHAINLSIGIKEIWMKIAENKRSSTLLITMVLIFFMISCTCSSLVPNENVLPAQLTEIADKVNQTQTAIAAKALTENAAAQPSPQPTSTLAPTDTPEPSPSASPTETTDPGASAPAVPSNTPSGGFTMQVEKTTAEFYCKSDPRKVTFTLKVSDINLGFAIYYHFEDPKTGKVSPNLKADIHRDPDGTYRFINMVGDPTVGADYYSVVVSLPAGMGPSKLVYEIIADDNSYRTPQKEDVMFYPCSYVKP
jgi:hypothetical protein